MADPVYLFQPFQSFEFGQATSSMTHSQLQSAPGPCQNWLHLSLSEQDAEAQSESQESNARDAEFQVIV